MYEVSNTSAGTRIFYDSFGKARTIKPGETVILNLTDKQHRNLIRDEGIATRAMYQEEPELPPVEPVPPEITPHERAFELLDAAKNRTMEFPNLLVAAKELLGDEWPGGTPKKSVIVACLRQFVEKAI